MQSKRNAIIFGDIADRANANNPLLTRNASLDESLDNMKIQENNKPRKTVTFKDCWKKVSFAGHPHIKSLEEEEEETILYEKYVYPLWSLNDVETKHSNSLIFYWCMIFFQKHLYKRKLLKSKVKFFYISFTYYFTYSSL